MKRSDPLERRLALSSIFTTALKFLAMNIILAQIADMTTFPFLDTRSFQQTLSTCQNAPLKPRPSFLSDRAEVSNCGTRKMRHGPDMSQQTQLFKVAKLSPAAFAGGFTLRAVIRAECKKVFALLKICGERFVPSCCHPQFGYACQSAGRFNQHLTWHQFEKRQRLVFEI